MNLNYWWHLQLRWCPMIIHVMCHHSDCGNPCTFHTFFRNHLAPSSWQARWKLQMISKPRRGLRWWNPTYQQSPKRDYISSARKGSWTLQSCTDLRPLVLVLKLPKPIPEFATHCTPVLEKFSGIASPSWSSQNGSAWLWSWVFTFCK